MLKQIPKRLWLIIISTVTLISGTVTIALSWSFVCTFSSKLMHNTYLLMIKPISILIVIFGLSALNLLLLTLYLLSINTTKYKNTFKNLGNDLPTSIEPIEKLPPTKNMNEILIYIKNNAKLSINSICKHFKDDKILIMHYLDLLFKSDYIEFYSDGHTFGKSIFDEYNPYMLSPKGREYLVENKLV